MLSICRNARGSSTVVDTGTADGNSGDFTLTHSDTSGSSLHQTASEGTVGAYTLDKTDASFESTTRVGNWGTGEYVLTGTTGSTSTAIETMTHATYGASFTEILAESASVSESGNDNFGVFASSESGTRTANFVYEGTAATRRGGITAK